MAPTANCTDCGWRVEYETELQAGTGAEVHAVDTGHEVEVSYQVCDFTARYSLPNATTEAREKTTERLAMNFDMSEVPPFREANQRSIAEY